ncbi:MAG: hypothetical protein WBV46_10905 [Terriglobales bacterium]|jgi:hypothetical protein
MDADFSIELTADDPVLDLPWTDASGQVTYYDLKRHPELISKVNEAAKFPELAAFLRSVNSPRSAFESAKCDAWTTSELSAEEEIFDAALKFSSYVDLVSSNSERRRLFDFHEGFARKLTDLLKRAPEMPASAEVCVRRCFFAESQPALEGFYFTIYVNGYGADEPAARMNWAIGLQLAGNAILQLSANP